MGRVHRANQACPPELVLVTTNLKAQRRFLSTIARRLDQLGALTKGQRQTASQGLLSSEFNLETPLSRASLHNWFVDLYRGSGRAAAAGSSDRESRRTANVCVPSCAAAGRDEGAGADADASAALCHAASALCCTDGGGGR